MWGLPIDAEGAILIEVDGAPADVENQGAKGHGCVQGLRRP